ncbi:MAG: hypothetical protein ACOYMV_11855 [Verrucomicrobiia bacterium]
MKNKHINPHTPGNTWAWSNTGLREFPNGTTFLHRGGHSEAIRVCQLVGNLPTDINWKAQDLSNLRAFYLKDACEFIVLHLPLK